MSSRERSVKVEVHDTRGSRVVRLRGQIDLRSSPQLRERLAEAIRGLSGTLAIDLSQVPYMDSSGVGTLVYVKREVEKLGWRLLLVGLQPRVRGVFEITHLDQFFTVQSDLDEGSAT